MRAFTQILCNCDLESECDRYHSLFISDLRGCNAKLRLSLFCIASLWDTFTFDDQGFEFLSAWLFDNEFIAFHLRFNLVANYHLRRPAFLHHQLVYACYCNIVHLNCNHIRFLVNKMLSSVYGHGYVCLMGVDVQQFACLVVCCEATPYESDN